MNYILRAMERLLGAIEHGVFLLRVRLHYRCTGLFPPGIVLGTRRIDAALAYASKMGEGAAKDSGPPSFPNSKWPAGGGFGPTCGVDRAYHAIAANEGQSEMLTCGSGDILKTFRS